MTGGTASRRRRDIAIVAAGQGVQQVLTLGTGITVARLLGSADYGVLNLLRSLFGAVAVVAPLGLDLQVLELAGQHPGDPAALVAATDRLRRLAFVINVVLALVVGVCLAGPLARQVYPYPGFETLLLVTALGLPLATDIAILGAFYRGTDRPAAFAAMTLYLQPLVRAAALASFAWHGLSALTVVVINTAQITISALALGVDERRWRRTHVPVAVPAPDWATLRPLVAASLWMAASLFVYGLMRVIDVLLLGYFGTARDVGAYGALTTVAQVVQIYPLAASQTLGPRVSHRFHAGDRTGLKAALDDYLATASLVGSFLFAGIAGWGDRLDLVFGRSFAFDANVALLLPLGALLSATLAPMGYALSMTGRHRSETGILCFGATTSIGLCCLLIPRFGPVGAAAASAASFAVVNLVRYVYVARTLRIVPGCARDLIAPPLALACAYAVRTLVDTVAPRSLVAMAAACLLYTGAFAMLAALVLLDVDRRTVVARRLGIKVYRSAP